MTRSQLGGTLIRCQEYLFSTIWGTHSLKSADQTYAMTGSWWSAARPLWIQSTSVKIKVECVTQFNFYPTTYRAGFTSARLVMVFGPSSSRGSKPQRKSEHSSKQQADLVPAPDLLQLACEFAGWSHYRGWQPHARQRRRLTGTPLPLEK